MLKKTDALIMTGVTAAPTANPDAMLGEFCSHLGKRQAQVKRRTSQEPNSTQPIRFVWNTAFLPCNKVRLISFGSAAAFFTAGQAGITAEDSKMYHSKMVHFMWRPVKRRSSHEPNQYTLFRQFVHSRLVTWLWINLCIFFHDATDCKTCCTV